jgi:hypothetical protein
MWHCHPPDPQNKGVFVSITSLKYKSINCSAFNLIHTILKLRIMRNLAFLAYSGDYFVIRFPPHSELCNNFFCGVSIIKELMLFTFFVAKVHIFLWWRSTCHIYDMFLFYLTKWIKVFWWWFLHSFRLPYLICFLKNIYNCYKKYISIIIF